MPFASDTTNQHTSTIMVTRFRSCVGGDPDKSPKSSSSGSRPFAAAASFDSVHNEEDDDEERDLRDYLYSVRQQQRRNTDFSQALCRVPLHLHKFPISAFAPPPG